MPDHDLAVVAGERPIEYNHLRVVGDDDVRYTTGVHLPESVHEREGDRVPGPGRLEYCPGGGHIEGHLTDVGFLLPHRKEPGDVLRRSVPLPVAPVAASAGEVVAGIDEGMPDLAGVPVCTEQEAAVCHHTAADPGGEGDVDDVIRAPGCARPAFSEDTGPGVVDQGDREPKMSVERFGDLYDWKRNVGRVCDPPAPDIQRPCRRDTDGCSPFHPCGLKKGLDLGHDRGGDHLPGGPGGWGPGRGVGEDGRI